jgi:glycine hydroxymethyltransferase
MGNLVNAKYVSLKALSGMNCMTMVIGSFSPPGGHVLTIPTSRGGHTHTEGILSQMGRTSGCIPYSVRDGWYEVNIPELREVVSKCSPDLIYFDPMIYLYEEDLKQIRSVVPRSTYLHFDCSHVLALIAGGICVNPLDVGFDSISASTHKTLPGVQKGFFATNNETHYKKFRRVGENLVSSIHAASVIGLAVALSEIRGHCKSYARQIVRNSQTLAECFKQEGFELVGRNSPRSACHVLLLNTRPYVEPTQAARQLSRAGVIAHPMTFPDPYGRSGLRLGVQEMTWLGMRESEMDEIAHLFSRILISKEAATSVREKVARLRSRYLRPPWACLDKELLEKLFNAMFDSETLMRKSPGEGSG